MCAVVTSGYMPTRTVLMLVVVETSAQIIGPHAVKVKENARNKADIKV